MPFKIKFPTSGFFLSNFLVFTASLLSLLLGFLVILGWHLQIDFLIYCVPDGIPMPYETAVSFIAVGAGLLFAILGWHFAAFLTGWFLLVPVLLIFIDYLPGLDLGISYLASPFHNFQIDPLHHMEPNTAICFIFMGLILIVTRGFSEMKKGVLFTLFLSAIVFALGSIAFAGQLLNVRSYYGWGNFTRMALHTSVGFIVLGISVYAFQWRAMRGDKNNVRRLGQAILAFTVTGTLATALIASAVAAMPLYERLEQYPRDQLFRLMDSKIHALVEFLDQARRVARQVRSKRPSLELLENYNAGNLSLNHYSQKTEPFFIEDIVSSKDLVGIIRFDQNGDLIAQAGRSIPEAIWPSDAFRRVESHFNGPVELGNILHFVMSSPVFGRRAQRSGTDILLFEPDVFTRILQFPVGVDEQGTIFLARKQQGKILLFSYDPKQGKGALIQAAENSDEQRYVEAALQDGSGYTEISGERFNVPSFILYSPVPGTDWVLLVSLRPIDFFNWVQKNLFFLFTILLGLIACGSLMMYVLVRPLTRGILIHTKDLEKEVAAKTEALKSEYDERQKAESAARESELLYQQILDAISDMVLVKGPNSRIIWGNKAFRTYYGMSNEQLRDIIDAPFNEPDYTEQYVKDDAYVFNHAKMLDIPEEPVTKYDGTISMYHTVKSPIMDKDGKVVMTVGVSRDITERKKAEMKISELQHAMEHAVEGIAQIDDGGNFKSVNKAFAELLTQDPSEFIGIPWRNFIYPQDQTKVDMAHLEMMRNGKGECEVRGTKKDGTVIHIQLSLIRILDHQEKYSGHYCFMKDITEKRYRDALEYKSELISMVSHELRTPLHSIKEGISIVLEQLLGDINEEQRDALTTSKRSVDRLVRLVNSVLDFQKIESGVVEFRREKNDLNQVIREVKKTMDPLAQGKGLRLNIELDGSLHEFAFDYDRITQVLLNLISNAIKFTERGTITVKSAHKDKVAEVKVTDTGIGIRDEDLPKIFRKFGQLESSKILAPGGTGLGLAISKRIIDRHRGRIEIHSVLHQGTTVAFFLPLE